MKTAARGLAVAILVLVTVTLQISVFDHLSVRGVVPDLAMLVVIGAALSRGADYGALIGFAAGLIIDLAPPADHIAGRWALSLLVVGYVTGLVRTESRLSFVSMVLAVAAGVFVGTSLFAMSGLVLGEPGVSVGSALRVIPLAVVYDVLLTPLVVPFVLRLFRRLELSPRW
jgi:rod shape-determining protein MreD